MMNQNKLPVKSLALGLAIGYILISAFWVLGNYQNTNGDYGQYYIHAQNLLKGRTWDHLMETHAAVLPGYPVILAAISLFFGDGVFPIGVMNSVLWAGGCLIALQYFLPQFQNRMTALAYFAACLFAAYIFSFQQDGQPNIAYAFLFIASLWAMDRLSIAATKTKKLTSVKNYLCIIIILLPAIFRIESLVIYSAAAILFITRKNFRYLWVALAGAGLTLGTDIAISLTSEMRSNILIYKDISGQGDKIDASIFQRFRQFIILYGHTTLSYVSHIPDLLWPKYIQSQSIYHWIAPNGLKTNIGILQITLFPLMIIGFLRSRSLWPHPDKVSAILSPDRLLFLGHIGFIGLFFLKTIPVRYLIPVLPLFLFYVFSGAERIAGKLKYGRMLFGLTAAGCIAYTSWNTVQKDHTFPKRKNYLFTPQTQAMADHVAAVKGERLVGLWKPRLMTVLLDQRRAATHKTQRVRRPGQVNALLDADGLFVNFVHRTRPSVAELLKTRTDICATWSNKSYILWELKKPGRACLPPPKPSP